MLLSFYFFSMTQAVATINPAMLARSQMSSNRTPTALDALHKVKVYNPNYFKNEEMDVLKKGRFLVTEAGTGTEVDIEWPLTVDVLALYKVDSGNIIVLDEYADPVMKNGEQVKKYYYTNFYHKFLKQTDDICFRSTSPNEPALKMTKAEYQSLIKTRNMNGMPNPFFEEKKKANGEKYKSTCIGSSDVLFGKFLDGAYEGEYFYMYLKSSSMGTDYDAQAKESILPDEGTLLRAFVDALPVWNAVLEANGSKRPAKSVSSDQVDVVMYIDTIVNENANKEFNVARFTYSGLSGMRGDNTEDLDYIKNIVHTYYGEKFASALPISVSQDPKNPNNVIIGHNFNSVEDDVVEVQEAQVQIEAPKQEVKRNPLEENISIEDCPF